MDKKELRDILDNSYNDIFWYINKVYEGYEELEQLRDYFDLSSLDLCKEKFLKSLRDLRDQVNLASN